MTVLVGFVRLWLATYVCHYAYFGHRSLPNPVPYSAFENYGTVKVRYRTVFNLVQALGASKDSRQCFAVCGLNPSFSRKRTVCHRCVFQTRHTVRSTQHWDATTGEWCSSIRDQRESRARTMISNHCGWE